jgi:predicted Zn-dependent protease
MFTVHYNSSREQFDEVKIGDIVCYVFGFASKVMKITKDVSSNTFYYVFYFENNDSKPVTVLKYLSKINRS